MMPTMLLLLVGSSFALAQDPELPPEGWRSADAPKERWRDEEINRKVLLDGTAYTPPQGQFRLGLFKQSWAPLSNLEISTNAALFAVAAPNVGAKVTAIQTKPIDVALHGSITQMDLGLLTGIEDGQARLMPVGFTASWAASRHLGLHLGGTWNHLRLRGEFTTEQIGESIALATGTNLNEDILAALQEIDDGTDLFAQADLNLVQSNFAADWRFNRRDSLVFRSTTFTRLDGKVFAGVQTVAGEEGGAELEAGPAARWTVPVGEHVDALLSLSWQMSWERFHLRFGIPLQTGSTWVAAIPQAFSMYWLLGPIGGKDEVGVEEEAG